MIRIELAVVAALVAFLTGWILAEAYKFYRDSKDKRWKSK